MSRIRQWGWVFLWLWFASGLVALRAADTNRLDWNPATGRVAADMHGEPLWPLLEIVARQTGWHVFVEPGADRLASAKFSDLASGDALRMLLGNLNFALVPQTNAPALLYVFRTTMQNATRPVTVKKPLRHVANELIVKLRPGANIDALARLIGAKVIGRNDKLGIYRLQFDDAAATDAALAQLKTNSDVEAVDYNYYFDPPPPMQPVTAASAAQPPVALTLDPPSSDNSCQVTVGLIDTSIQSLGSSLDPFILKQLSVAGVANPNSTTPLHATAMAQTILRAMSQATTNGTSARILPVDVYGAGESTTSWNVALGIQLAVDKGANVLNLSLGSSGDSAVLDSVIQQAVADGILIFAAAGNVPVNTPTYPAAVPGVNAVTALQQPGQLAAYANYGSFVDLALPGASVIYLNGQPWVVQGTSVSTAYATGVAGGTKTANCAGWPQIQTAMQKKFTVPKQ